MFIVGQRRGRDRRRARRGTGEVCRPRTGEAIGEIAVLTDLRRTAALRCRTPAHLLVLKGTDFRTLLHRHPPISSRIIEHLAKRLAAATPG